MTNDVEEKLDVATRSASASYDRLAQIARLTQHDPLGTALTWIGYGGAYLVRPSDARPRGDRERSPVVPRPPERS
jgi:hypothetical protein